MRVSFYRDRSGPREFDLPVTVGFRPGYLYRIKLTGIPEHPGLALAPTLEVRGSLYPSPRVNPARYPAPLAFGETVLDRILEGVFVTRVVYLEHPDKAIPTATRPDQPVERTLPVEADLWESAREFGRPVLLIRLGERQADETDLRQRAIPGTILFPGEQGLAPPAAGPCLPWAGYQVHDPVLGPRPPEEECLHDGGDTGRPAGIDNQGRLGGLDPSDTVAEYTDSQGRRRLARSNRICLCVPRFAMLRSELPLAGFLVRTGPGQAPGMLAQKELGMRVPSLQTAQQEQLGALRSRIRPGGTAGEQGVGRLLRLEVLEGYLMSQGPGDLLGTAVVQQLGERERVQLTKQLALARNVGAKQSAEGFEQSRGPAVVGRVDGMKLVTATAELRDLTAICGETPQLLMDRPLLLNKWADRTSAQVGDVVTFSLRYSNNGGQPIDDVAVSDSLTGRLEYIPGSARSDRNAVFTLQENTSGSLILRWEISGRLLPGESGKVTFQARIR
jgi:uncharacterized repeat protein (TIGR01451 family)